jgi:hypothetical protein
VWTGHGGEEKEVALKTLKTDQAVDRIKLLQEAVIMVQFQHPNVLYLYGVAGQDETVRMIIITQSHRTMRVHTARTQILVPH